MISERRSLGLTPAWSVGCVLTMFVAVSLLLHRSIHHLSHWLKKTNRKPLLATLDKMKEELMLLGFISLFLTATSKLISNICIPSYLYNTAFTPCATSQIHHFNKDPKLFMSFFLPSSSRRALFNTLNLNTCKKDYEPFVSYEGLEQLHRFIFIMAVTHISYSCLTMLLAVVKMHRWRAWENEAQMDRNDLLSDVTKEKTIQRQSILVGFHTLNPLVKNGFIIWMICFFRQFGSSVVSADYHILRKGFITNHNLTSKYDFHSYMVRSMEEECQRIVGVSALPWGFVVTFMLFNVKGSNLYFWIAIIPVTLVLVVGTKLQHIIATLALESAGVIGFISGTKLKPRDELFWFKKPELLLTLIHLILFQNAFELASFFWFWREFGYNSCLIKNHKLVYLRLTLGFAGQFLCSYSTLPLYALATQMGTNYKAALIPEKIRETIDGWGKDARRRKRHGNFADDSTVNTDTSTFLSVEEYEDHENDSPQAAPDAGMEIEMQSPAFLTGKLSLADETSSLVDSPFCPSTTVPSTTVPTSQPEGITKSSSMAVRSERGRVSEEQSKNELYRN